MRTGKSLFAAEVSDSMSRSLSALHKNDALDDQFFMTVSQDGQQLVTGAYDKSAHVMDINAQTNRQVLCKHNQKKGS